MPCPKNGPCSPFATELDLCCLTTGQSFEDPCLTDGGQPVPQEIIDNALEAASEILWAATGRQFGTCQVKIRPCKSSDACSPCPDGGELPYWSSSSGAFPGWGAEFSSFPFWPSMSSSGVWTNISCGCSGCCALCHIDLPYPVCSVDEVKVDGRVLDPSEYRVDDFRELIRLMAPAPAPIEGLRLGTVQFGPDAVDDQWCFNINPDVVNAAVQVPNTFCYDFTNSNPDFTWLSEDSVTATYAGIGPHEGGVFTISDAINGQWIWPVNNTPMQPGETRRSDPRLDGSQMYLTWNGPGPGPFYTGINWERPDSDVSYSMTFTHMTLQPTDGKSGCWPTCQNLILEDTEVDTFSVTVTYGRPVPALIKMATASLACEFIKSCVGQPCMLPQRIQSISRQGVTVGFLDPMDFLAQGRTGIYIVDLAIKTFNPRNLLKNASVYSPDVGRRWRRTDTA